MADNEALVRNAYDLAEVNNDPGWSAGSPRTGRSRTSRPAAPTDPRRSEISLIKTFDCYPAGTVIMAQQGGVLAGASPWRIDATRHSKETQ
jgi:hypothetical protein